MTITTATSVTHELGPLAKVVEAHTAKQIELIGEGINSPEDWQPLTEFLEPTVFKRVGAYLEELDWPAYRKFLTGWVSGGTRFEMTTFHISEVGNSVFQEIEERHYRGDEFIRKNVIAVYRFNDQQKIVHLDIYEQARDSGEWIAQAAKAATAS
ncbi:hypothetical protein LJR225_005228 [Phenylobacterium sp. LjRoot225]|uniref:hypothetical protein n=1 Tax=Phenylobacterium sp. LjRoot225 TaxID=3342285 RepID=UPI003ECD0009